MGRKKTRSSAAPVARTVEAKAPALWRQPRARLIAWAVALTGLYAVAFQATKDDRVYLGGDNADYHILAESIASGQGYRYVAMPEAPLHNHLPPGYPVVLALFMKMGITEHASLAHLNGLFLWVALMCLLVVFTRWCDGPDLPAVAIGLCALNAHLLGFATILMSEIPYLMLFSIALVCHSNALRMVERGRGSRWWFLGLVAVCIVMVYMRTAGLATVIAFGAHLLWRRQRAWAAALVCGVLLSQVPWQVRSARIGANPYVRQLMSVSPYHPERGEMKGSDWPRRVVENAVRYAMREVPNSVLPWTTRRLDSPLRPSGEWPWMVIVLSLLIGGLWRLPHENPFVIMVLFCSFGVLMLWPPVWAGTRFMMALVPFCVLLTLNGVRALVMAIAARIGAPAWTVWAGTLAAVAPVVVHSRAHVLLEGPGYNGRAIMDLAAERVVKVDRNARICYALCIAGLSADRHDPYAQGYGEYLALAEWAGDHLPHSADSAVVVCCRKPGLFHLLSHHQVTGFLKTADPATLIADLERKKVTHVVLDQLGFADVGRYLYPAVQRDWMKFPVLKEILGPDNKGAKSITRLTRFMPRLGYQGEWQQGLKHGRGTMRFADGSTFEGIWLNDTVNGHGILRSAKGGLTEGQWYHNALQGAGRVVKGGRVVQEGLFRDGVMMEAHAAAGDSSATASPSPPPPARDR